MRRVIATTLTIVYLAFVPFYFFSAATTHAPPYISVTECIKRPDIPSRPNRLFLRPLPLNFALACTRISRVHPLQQVFSSEHTPPLLFFLHGIPPSRFSLQKKLPRSTNHKNTMLYIIKISLWLLVTTDHAPATITREKRGLGRKSSWVLSRSRESHFLRQESSRARHLRKDRPSHATCRRPSHRRAPSA